MTTKSKEILSAPQVIFLLTGRVEELIPSSYQAETGLLRYALAGTLQNPHFCFPKRPPHAKRAGKIQPKSSAAQEIVSDKPSGIWEG